MKKIILHLLLPVLFSMIFCFFVSNALAVTYNGCCGNNVFWTLEGNVLTLTGSGPMDDYVEQTPEWNNFTDSRAETVIVGNGITHIGKHAFNREWVFSVTLPSSVTSIGEGAFSHAGITTIDLPENLTDIGRYAFSSCEYLYRITLPSNVQTIGYGAFSECHNLTEFAFSDNVKHIPDYTFYCCYRLESIRLSNSLQTIGQYSFYQCVDLKTIDIPASVSSIDALAFLDCTSLSSVNFPSNSQLCVLNTGAFSNTSLTALNLPNSLEDIGPYAFSDCTKLKKAIIPDGVKTIQKGAFQECENLTSITLGKNVETIESSVFSFTKIKTIFLPAKVKAMNMSAFSNDIYLERIDVDPKNQTYCSIDGVLFNKNKTILHIFPRAAKLADYTVPMGVNKIDDGAFFNAASLEKVVLQKGIKTIGAYAFFCCGSLSKIWIPSSLKTIEKCAFSGCPSLTVYYNGTKKDWDSIKISKTVSYFGESNEPILKAKVVYDVITITSIKLNKTKATLTRTSKKKTPTLTLKVKVSPKDATDPSVKWKSSDPKVAKVDKNGTVTALKKGKVVITCTTKDGSKIKAQCTITIKNKLISSITLNKAKVKIKKGKTYQLEIEEIKPASAFSKKVNWTSSDETIAVIDKNGKVTAKKKGTCIITCTAADGSEVKAECKITVN